MIDAPASRSTPPPTQGLDRSMKDPIQRDLVLAMGYLAHDVACDWATRAQRVAAALDAVEAAQRARDGSHEPE